jgi:pilus assembly protein CpaC
MNSRSIRWSAVAAACVLVLAAPSAPPLQAQQNPPAGTAIGAPQAPAERLNIISGRSRPLDMPFDIETFQVTDPEIADVVVVNARELIVNGKRPGTISLWIWGGGRRLEYEVVVDPGTTTLQQRFNTLYPGEDIQVSVTAGAILLSGRVSTNDIMLRVAEIAQASSPDQRVINLLQLPGGNGSQQVMLQVRFAEVNSKAVRELGVNLFVNRSNFAARATTQQFPAPAFSDEAGGGLGGLVFADFLNLFFLQRNQGVGAVIRALEQSGSFESLAEPNLIAYNGQEANFLAGGEVPILSVSGNGAVNVAYKEFGVRLRFRPTIAGDMIRLHVRPEVSALDFGNGITSQGFRIPALITRYAETEVELRDGQSFAIAGLLDHVGQEDVAAIPFLSQIPVIGNLFKSKAKREDRTELMVLITPRLVRALNPDEVPPLPTIIKPPTGGRGGGSGTVAEQVQGGAGLVDAPAQPSATKKDAPAQPSAAKKDAPVQPSAVKKDAPAQPVVKAPSASRGGR